MDERGIHALFESHGLVLQEWDKVQTDLLTIRERLGGTAGATLAYLGDTANNMAHSYALAGTTAGLRVRLSGPAGFGTRGCGAVERSFEPRSELVYGGLGGAGHALGRHHASVQLA